MTLSARQECKSVITELMPAESWRRNCEFSDEIQATIEAHPLLKHPLIGAFSGGQLDHATLRRVHLEFRYTFAETFTDGLLHSMLHAARLEPRYGSLGKVAARFLLSFNLFDELGFRTDGAPSQELAGSPRAAHYHQFHLTLGELGVSEAEARAYVPSDAAVACRRQVEKAYTDPITLICLLAVEETVFERFAGPWAQNMKQRTSVDTSHGYHSIHVEHDGASVDDHHAEDLWYVFRMFVEPHRYDDVRRHVGDCLDSLVRFVDSLAQS